MPEKLSMIDATLTSFYPASSARDANDIEPQSALEISIVIPTIDSMQTLPRLIDSILGQLDESRHEIVFLDSESVDGTLEFIDSIPFAKITTHPIRRRDFSHSRTRMFGAQAARGRLVVFLSDDVVPLGEQFLADLCKPLHEGSAAASYGVSLICNQTGDPLRAHRYNGWYRDRPDVVLPVSEGTWNLLSPRQRYDLCRFDNCASCFDRKLLLRVGFPDVAYGEDIAIARRLLLSGYPIALAKKAKFCHWHNVGYRYLLKRMCIDQMLVRDLFGLVFIGNMPKLVAIIFLQLCLYMLLGVTVSGIPVRRRLHWIIYNIRFILADNAGKYMGCLENNEVPAWNILGRYLVRKKEAIQEEVLKLSLKRD